MVCSKKKEMRYILEDSKDAKCVFFSKKLSWFTCKLCVFVVIYDKKVARKLQESCRKCVGKWWKMCRESREKCVFLS